MSSKIQYGCGVRQGDPLAATIFIIVIQHVAELIDKRFRDEKISTPSLIHSGNTRGSIRKQGKWDNKNLLLNIAMFLCFSIPEKIYPKV